ncbi:ABC transporter permease [Micrococcaceae bacterium Sec5.1]
MKAAMRYEWVRLTTTKGFLVLSAMAFAGAVVVSWAMTMMMVAAAPEMTDAAAIEAAAVAATRTPFLLLAAGLLGAFSFAQEKRHGTLIHALLAVPNRRTLYTAKICITMLITTLWAVVTVPIAVAVSNLVLNTGHPFQSDPRVLLGFVALANLWALTGIAAGILLSRTGAIIFLIAGSTMIEPLLGQLLARIDILGTSGAAYLPFTAGAALISFEEPGFAAVLAETAPRLPALAGAVVFLAYIMAAQAFAFRRVLRAPH